MRSVFNSPLAEVGSLSDHSEDGSTVLRVRFACVRVAVVALFGSHPT